MRLASAPLQNSIIALCHGLTCFPEHAYHERAPGIIPSSRVILMAARHRSG
ncbi:MAG: hypothetical protein MZV64_36930 [Ignavibacteriales bacterium]|nr:hypothetical protein [Ignavibacteriales bacterium]